MKHHATACVIVLLISCLLRKAEADPAMPTNAVAREHLTRGNKLYNLRSFAEAAVEYKAGALLDPSPIFYYNLGQCYRNSGQYEAAIWHYQRFLEKEAPDEELRNIIDGFITQMRAELDHKAMTQKPTEPAPAAIPASVSKQHLTGSAIGSTDHQSRWYNDRIGWILVGAGTVGIAVSGGYLVNAADLDARGTASSSQLERITLKDHASTQRRIGAISGVAGLGLLAIGIAKFALHSSDDRRTSVSVSFAHNSIAVDARF